MTYQNLRTEAVKTSIALTNAMLCKNKQLIELETFKLNNIIAEMLDVMKNNIPEYENTYTEIKRTNENLKR
jgi:hypothetical protein